MDPGGRTIGIDPVHHRVLERLTVVIGEPVEVQLLTWTEVGIVAGQFATTHVKHGVGEVVDVFEEGVRAAFRQLVFAVADFAAQLERIEVRCIGVRAGL